MTIYPVPDWGFGGTGVERALWAMKRGGASETERSAYATIPFPGLKSPNVSLSRSDQRKKQSGSEAIPDGRLSNSLFLFERSMSSWPVLFENSISISHLNRQSNPPRAFPRGIEVCLHAASRARRNAPVSIAGRCAVCSEAAFLRKILGLPFQAPSPREIVPQTPFLASRRY